MSGALTGAPGTIGRSLPASPARLAAAARVERAIADHAHLWLVAGCGTGLLLASLLLSPRLGDWLAPLGYGRWAALHLDLTLYGWLALPLVGLLLRAWGAIARPALAAATLALWSGALLAGAASWLAGETSGKLFLDWSGAAARFFALAQGAIVLLLIAGAWSAYGEEAAARPLGAARRRLAARWAGAAALAAVPAALLFAERADVYPAIDPASGGPTAASLLASTLALVALLAATPRLAGLARVGSHAERGGAVVPFALAAHAALWAAVDHGDRANDAPQFLLLATVGIWALLLPWEYRRFAWPPSAGRWLRALQLWGALLVAGGVVQFLALPLAALKFTHGLVAHAHLAMAGFASSYGGLLLRLGGSAWAPAGERGTFWLWQTGTAAHVAALAAIGGFEAGDPAFVLRGGAALDGLLALRWAAGATMLLAAARWLGAAPRSRR